MASVPRNRETDTKVCVSCRTKRHPVEFRGKNRTCVRCTKKVTDWKRDHPQQNASQRLSYRVRQYGITPEDFERLWTQQSGRCPLCEKRLRPGRQTHIDHDHRTRRVRGLLCQRCNRCLGWVEVAVGLLKVTEYIANPEVLQ